eukprot:XP_017944846.1 PREDICTED: interleukin-17F [Xenopus tropicalis]
MTMGKSYSGMNTYTLAYRGEIKVGYKQEKGKKVLFDCHVTLLLFILGVSTTLSVHGLDLHHLSKGCPPPRGLNLNQPIKVTLNISGQSQALGKDISKRSLAPWDYSFDMDNNRFPSMIAEAKCRYAHCLDAEGNLDLDVNTVPIKQEILVLRREMKGCTPSFKLEKKMVTVGCTCVRPEVKEQQQ